MSLESLKSRTYLLKCFFRFVLKFDRLDATLILGGNAFQLFAVFGIKESLALFVLAKGMLKLFEFLNWRPVLSKVVGGIKPPRYGGG